MTDLVLCGNSNQSTSDFVDTDDKKKKKKALKKCIKVSNKSSAAEGKTKGPFSNAISRLDTDSGPSVSKGFSVFDSSFCCTHICSKLMG